MQLNKSIFNAVRALGVNYKDSHLAVWMNASEEDLTVLQKKVSSHWLFTYKDTLRLAVVSFFVFAVSLYFYHLLAVEGDATWQQYVGFTLIAWIMGGAIGFVVWSALHYALTAPREGVLNMLKPAGSQEHRCAGALAIVESIPAARAYRDAIIGKGRQLRVFDLGRMELIRFMEQNRIESERSNEACKALHGLTAV